jgi:hypothetical protein
MPQLLQVFAPLVRAYPLHAQRLYVCCRHVHAGFELLDRLLRIRKCRLKLPHLEPARLRIDLEEDGAGLDQHVALDGDCDDLAGNIRRHIHHAPQHGDSAGRREAAEERQEHADDSNTDGRGDVSGQLAPADELELGKYQPNEPS